MTVYLVMSLSKIPYIRCTYVCLCVCVCECVCVNTLLADPSVCVYTRSMRASVQLTTRCTHVQTHVCPIGAVTKQQTCKYVGPSGKDT